MKIYKMIRLAIKYLVMYLSMLMPRSKKIYVFGAWLGEKYADNTKALFEVAQKRKNIRCIWIGKNPAVVAEVRALGYEAYAFTSLKGIWFQLRAKYAFETNGISDFKHAFLGRAILINLWHGIPLKKICYDDKYERNWDSFPRKVRDKIVGVPLGNEYVVATSETIAKIYQSAFRRPEKKILCLGQPRNDVLFQPYEKQIFSGKKIILYAPTHRKEGKEPICVDTLFDLDKIQEFCEKNDYYFVIKKHFYHKAEKEPVEKYSRILDMTSEQIDTQILLLETDVMITDYSSIYIDYMLLDRPILFYAYDYEEYLKEDREMYFSYEDVTPGPKIWKAEGVLPELQKIARGERYSKEERERILDLFYCEEGRGAVSEKLLDWIEE